MIILENNEIIIKSFSDVSRTCCFTGHRDMTLSEKESAAERIKRAVCALVSRGVTNFITGGALGFDTVAAVTVINMKRSEFPEIKLALAIPFRGQPERWRVVDRALYDTIMKAANEVVILSEEYADGCMMKRNRFMVDHSAYCLSYVKKNYGGSYYTEKYARSKGLKVLNLAEVNW